MLPSEARQTRLKNDYVEMTNIRGQIVQWRPINGTPPFVTSYEVTLSVRTLVDSSSTMRANHVVRVELPEGYPVSPPAIVMVTRPKPFHPNWYPDGRYCYGSWDIAEGLGHHIVRMIRTLQFDPEITDPNSPADGSARDYYVANARSGQFPTDQQVLPDPTTGRFVVLLSAPKAFRIVER